MKSIPKIRQSKILDDHSKQTITVRKLHNILPCHLWHMLFCSMVHSFFYTGEIKKCLFTFRLPSLTAISKRAIVLPILLESCFANLFEDNCFNGCVHRECHNSTDMNCYDCLRSCHRPTAFKCAGCFAYGGNIEYFLSVPTRKEDASTNSKFILVSILFTFLHTTYRMSFQLLFLSVG